MIELTVLDYLKSNLKEKVCTEYSSDSEFVLIEKTSGGKSNCVSNATIAIQSYSSSLFNAAKLNEHVKEVMLGDGSNKYGIIELDCITKCELNSDYNYPDTTNKRNRYQAIFDLVYYE